MIEDMILKIWYNEWSKSEAILTPMYFENGIPLETLTLICAGVRLKPILMFSYYANQNHSSRMHSTSGKQEFL